MSKLQESLLESHVSSGATTATARKGLCESSNRIVWGRSDWALPVGHFYSFRTTRVHSILRGVPLDWELVRIAELWLEHRTAILLLQGRPLTALLIPNQLVDTPFAAPTRFAHVLLRTDPWEFWRSAPVLTNLVLARLGEIPAGLTSAEVLAELAERSAR